MSITIGIDIGGTFTDVVSLDTEGNVAAFAKVASTPHDPGAAVVAGVDKILGMVGKDRSDLERVAHSSTVSLNAILERKGAKLGILCTEGFEDILVIGRQKRTDMYDLFLDPETPQFLCPRERMYGIPERLDSSGDVVVDLNEEAVVDAARRLVDCGVTSIAICFLFSYLAPDHERRARDLIGRQYPDVKISISSEVDPHMREYERLVMTAFDAYLKPVAETYLRNLADNLTSESSAVTLQIMQSRGGIVGWRQAAERPITTALSGPAAGVIGAGYCGRGAGATNLISVDIGGTSCDIALITGGKPLVTGEGKLDRYPLRQQMVDVSCIGAGGGSIAWVDQGGALKVGPQSAGASPGPACYGRGGTEPTITDASLVLGYLDAEEFGWGEVKAEPERAREALGRLGDKIGMDVPTLALGMHRIINAMMADAIKLASVDRGYDPRKFALMGLGGGGPVHAAALAASLGCRKAIIPPLPGVLCANGLLAAQIEHEQSRTFLRKTEHIDLQEMEREFTELTAVCRQRMAGDGVDPDAARVNRFAYIRYSNQSYDLEIALDGTEPVGATTVERIVGDFNIEHERLYGYSRSNQETTIVALGVVLSHPVSNPVFAYSGEARSVDEARKSSRMALFDLNEGYRSTDVYDRQKLPVAARIAGPAILEQRDTTTILFPGQHLVVDAVGNLIIEPSVG
ncbi:hydantoinase/oxoprolinase family protein [Microbaculum marinum]|uniref:Hydantoinase/oxoprolinase family protein n=1 Tax=Microbaculum marinum TaxID=1764581 RepID=A0AAW9RMU1_9HYPH